MAVDLSGNVVLDFYTTTCQPCKMLGVALDAISKEFPAVKIIKLNVENNPEQAVRFGVMSVPTLILLKDNKVAAISRGFSSKSGLTNLIRTTFLLGS
jgi:thioredoxin 1